MRTIKWVVLPGIVVFAWIAVGDQKPKPPASNQKGMTKVSHHVVIADSPRITSASLGEKPFTVLPGKQQEQVYGISKKNLGARRSNVSRPSALSAMRLMFSARHLVTAPSSLLLRRLAHTA